MPNSLKCRLKKLKHQGLLSEKDLSRIYTDKDVIEKLESLKPEIESIRDVEVTDGCVYVSSDVFQKIGKDAAQGYINGINSIDVNEILDKKISELKGE